MGGHASLGREKPDGRVHAMDVVRAGLAADEDRALTALLHLHRAFRRERDLASCRARSRRQSLAD